MDASAEPANLAGVDASQPPPDPPANTERTRSVHFEDSTDEEDAPAAGGGPADPDDDDPDDDDDDEDDDEDDDNEDWTALYVREQQADLPDYVVTEADRRLDKVYGDHPHSNAGTHLSGGVDQDKLWQNRWLETMQLATTTYTVPRALCGQPGGPQLHRVLPAARDRRHLQRQARAQGDRGERAAVDAAVAQPGARWDCAVIVS